MNKANTQIKAARACAVSLVLAIMLVQVQISFEGHAPVAQVKIPAASNAPQSNEDQSWFGFLFARGNAHYTPLSSREAKAYKEIFALQDQSNFKQADLLINKLNDTRLLGHVLAQRYLSPAYKSTPKELKQWLVRYDDHPQADRIHKLAARQGNASGLHTPKLLSILAPLREPTMRKTKIFEGNAQEKSALQQDKANAKEAARLMFDGKHDKALRLAMAAADRSGEAAPRAGWIAGLIFWQSGEYEKAAHYFAKTGASEYAGAWQASAGAYWAARSYTALGNHKQAKNFLKLAASHSHTFYGMIAAQNLNQRPDLAWDAPRFNYAREKTLTQTTAGQRAMALVAAEQYALAESELLRLEYKNNPDLKEAALSYAAHIGLPSASLRLAGYLNKDNGRHYDSALYPTSPWSPEGGYTIDPALVHAIIRQESRFNPTAISPSGAQGLMQLIPSTAQYMARKNGHSEDLSAITPEMNMRLGQDYIGYLFNDSAVQGDLVSMLIAYNAGPGNLRKWQSRNANAQDDILLFIETLPVQETRDYVKYVMTNYWVYRHRAGENTNTLAQLAAGKPASYANTYNQNRPSHFAAR